MAVFARYPLTQDALTADHWIEGTHSKHGPSPYRLTFAITSRDTEAVTYTAEVVFKKEPSRGVMEVIELEWLKPLKIA